MKHRARLLPVLCFALGCSSSKGAANSCITPDSPSDGSCSGLKDGFFGGVDALAPDATGSRIRVSWKPAVSTAPQPPSFRYRVYVSRRPGKALERAPILTTEPGQLYAWFSTDSTSEPAYVVVRAVTPEGIEDTNVVEKNIVAKADTTPPVFDGIAEVGSAPNQGVALNWVAASDDFTPQSAISYAIFAGAGAIDFSRPIAMSDFGATSIVLPNQGLPGVSRTYAVRALDAAGNTDSNLASRNGAVGPDTEPPMFAGCNTVTSEGSNGVRVTWLPAADNVSAAESITYDLFAGASATSIAFDKPIVSVKGATTARIPATPGSTVFILCRARDAGGTTDSNANIFSATTTTDLTAPIFTGASTIDLSKPDTVTLTWSAATDETTPAERMTYEVFERTESGSFNFESPAFVTAAGANSATLTNRNPTERHYWVVRARDEGWNRDGNLNEVAGQPLASFAFDVQPILTNSCAVIGCHTPGIRGGSIILSTGFAYAELVDKDSAQSLPADASGVRVKLKRVAPGDVDGSYLVRKILAEPGRFSGKAMPAPGTGNTLTNYEKQVIVTWIAQGAENN